LIRIPQDADTSWNPALVAGSIAAFVRERGGYDLIITGKQTGPGESGLIPRMLASGLGLPCIPEVFSLKYCSRGIRVISKTDAGQAVMTVTKPAVYAVGEALHSYLRVPTLREKIAAGSKEPGSRLPAGTCPVLNTVQFLKYVYTMPQRQCRMIEGNNTEEKMETLWAYLQKAGVP
jgi:electron transfer flavoprotein alpha/beta subunit